MNISMTSLFNTFMIYFSKGGIVMWFILLVSVVAWFLGLGKYFYFHRFNIARKRFLKTVKNIIKGKFNKKKKTGIESFDFLIDEIEKSVKDPTDSCDFRLLYKEFLIATVPEIEKQFATISAWISAAPLLGLFGTVTGMIATFKTITDYGLGNPNLTAEGISIALITTQAGLTVAFPMMMFHNYLVNISNRIVTNIMMDGETLVLKINRSNKKN